MAEMLFDRYEVVEVLKATDAIVSYKVIDPRGRESCLKVVEASAEEAEVDLRAIRRLMTIDHPQVARTTAAEATDNGYYFIRDWVPGSPLEPGITGAEKPEDARKLITDACTGVGAIHAAGAVHGSLSPSNLIRREDGVIVVVDGGVRRQTRFPPGAPPELGQYIAPEQAQGLSIRPQTDVYVLGVMLYELLAGDHPFEGPDASSVVDFHRVQPLPKPSVTRDGVPDDLDTIVARSTMKSPGQRYADANLMREALVAGRSRLGRSAWLWALLALGIAVAVLLTVLLLSGDGETAPVPDVTGMTVAEAETTLSEAGFRPGEIDEEETLEAEPGIVLSQDPEANTEAELDSEVALLISSVPMIETPDVTGVSEAEATARLGQAGLRIGSIERAASEDVEAGFVISQEPAPGTTLRAGDEVDLIVSQGAPEEEGLRIVPNVVGMEEEAAASSLESAGFRVRSRIVEGEEPAGIVISQDPAAGTEAEENTRIAIEVSEGPPEQVTVPDVVGMGLLDARQSIRDADLRVDYEWVQEGAPFLQVLRQEPPPGTSLAQGEDVSVAVSLPSLGDLPGFGDDETTTTGSP